MTTTFFMPPSARVCRSARQRKAGPVQDARRRTARRQAQVPDKHVTNRLNLPHKESRKTRRVGGPKFRSFFLPLLPQISFFSSLSWWSSRGILVVFFEALGSSNVHGEGGPAEGGPAEGGPAEPGPVQGVWRGGSGARRLSAHTDTKWIGQKWTGPDWTGQSAMTRTRWGSSGSVWFGSFWPQSVSVKVGFGQSRPFQLNTNLGQSRFGQSRSARRPSKVGLAKVGDDRCATVEDAVKLFCKLTAWQRPQGGASQQTRTPYPAHDAKSYNNSHKLCKLRNKPLKGITAPARIHWPISRWVQLRRPTGPSSESRHFFGRTTRILEMRLKPAACHHT